MSIYYIYIYIYIYMYVYILIFVNLLLETHIRLSGKSVRFGIFYSPSFWHGVKVYFVPYISEIFIDLFFHCLERFYFSCSEINRSLT